MERADIAVIGAGFGGLGAALSLAERGADVLVLETLAYPGGCASTFTRGGARFEAGATLFSGFGDGHLFRTWIDRHRLDVRVDLLDTLVTLRTPSLTLDVPSDRAAFVRHMEALAPRREDRVRSFFAAQQRAADALWALFRDPAMLPPFGLRELLRHATRVPRYLPLLPWVGRPLSAMVEEHGLEAVPALRVFLDAVCQITVQAPSDEAEAPFALGAMDYFFRGTGHVHGGIGELAWALAGAVQGAGGRVRMATRVRGLRRVDGRWRLEPRRGPVDARVVIANVLPQALSAMLPPDVKVSPRLARLRADVESSWGAAMRYLVVEPGAVGRPEPHHLELVADPDAPLVEGNHVFCSVSGADEDRAPDGGRTVTVSTHLPMDTLRAAPDPADYVAAVQARMDRTLAALAPELSRGVRSRMPASPRTFERFTGRPSGLVGGIPRRHGLRNYRDLWPAPVSEDLYLVGDSVFPGQSTLATALGGVKLADHLVGRRAPRATPAEALAPTELLAADEPA
ncbi:MAG: phytoene desaturase family protein [Sandaracinaceae bacterium]